MAESSTKPYLIRALHEWCCDNGYTPYLAVVVDRQTVVPRQHVKNGEIVLNVSPLATSHMQMGNDLIEFQARFSGVAQQLSIPVENVAAIYARETGHGMAFEVARPAPVAEGDEEAPLQDEGAGAAGAIPQAARDAGRDAGATQGAQQAGTRAPSAARKRAGKSQGGADVIAFASPLAGRKGEAGKENGAPRKGPAAVEPPASAGDEARPAAAGGTGASDQGLSTGGPDGGNENRHEAGDDGRNINGADSPGRHPDDHDEPPPPAGGRGGRTRLTRVK